MIYCSACGCEILTPGDMGQGKRCRLCTNEYHREWQGEHPEKTRVYARKWRAKNSSMLRSYTRNGVMKIAKKASGFIVEPKPQKKRERYQLIYHD